MPCGDPAGCGGKAFIEAAMRLASSPLGKIENPVDRESTSRRATGADPGTQEWVFWPRTRPSPTGLSVGSLRDRDCHNRHRAESQGEK
jgi:hypothetical protein